MKLIMSSNNQKVYKPLTSGNNMKTVDYLLYRMGAKKASNTKYFAFDQSLNLSIEEDLDFISRLTITEKQESQFLREVSRYKGSQSGLVEILQDMGITM